MIWDKSKQKGMYGKSLPVSNQFPGTDTAVCLPRHQNRKHQQSAAAGRDETNATTSTNTNGYGDGNDVGGIKTVRAIEENRTLHHAFQVQ